MRSRNELLVAVLSLGLVLISFVMPIRRAHASDVVPAQKPSDMEYEARKLARILDSKQIVCTREGASSSLTVTAAANTKAVQENHELGVQWENSAIVVVDGFDD
jgi:hypothetical protein